MKYNFSIIICCYNSAQRISYTLKHIAKQKINDAIKWEVIVVNNNSSDLTSKIALDVWRETNSTIDFKIIDETKPGLSFARKKGTAESKGDYVIFCDDDNWLDENYIQKAHEITNKNDKIGMLGGQGIAFIEGKIPEWFEKEKYAFAVGAQNEIDGDITSSQAYVYGAGAVIKRELLLILDEIGFNHVLTDRIGKRMVSGGDNEIGYAIVLLNYKIYYSSELKFQHCIPNNRLTLKYLKKFRIGQTYTATPVTAYENFIFNNDATYKPILFKKSVTKNLKKIIKLSIQFVKGNSSYSEFYIAKAKLFSVIKYYFFNKQKDYDDYLKVQENIKLILNYNKSKTK